MPRSAPLRDGEEDTGSFGSLRAERDALRQVIEHAPEASLVMLDRDFNFLYANSTYAESCRMKVEDLLGRNHFELFPSENEEIFRRARDTGEPVEFKAKPFVFAHDPGRGVTYWDWSLTPIKDEDGTVASLVFSLVDVTDRVVRERLTDALARLDVLLHSSLDTEEIIRAVIAGAKEASGCDSVGVALRDGPEWVGYFSGEPLGHLDRARFGAAEVPVAERAAATRETVIVNDVEADEGVSEPLRKFGLKSVMNVPLLVRGEVIGVLGFDYHEAPVAFSAQLVEFGERVGASLSLAIANARIVENQNRKARFEDALNRMLTVFVTAKNPDDVLREVVEESMRACGADYSILSFIENGDWVVRYAFGEGGNGRVPIRYRFDERPVLADVARDSKLVLVRDAQADPRTNKSIMTEFGIRAFAAIPLIVRGEFTGVVELVYTKHSVVFWPETREFLDKLVSTVSVALDQAREVQRDHRVAETLQEAMLVLPTAIPGIEFAHAYHSASDATRVGGDFYDVFELDNGLAGITIGDVSGKGLNAAAFTSLVKNAIRAHATEKGTTPADAVALADKVLFRGSDPDMFATIVFGMLDRRDGRLVYCNAGHPSAAVVRSDGSVARLVATSPLAGALPGVAFRNAETRLEPGDVLFLYTDGLTEARRGTDLFGEERVFDALQGLGGVSPDELLAKMREAVTAFGGATLADDLAVLALRRGGPDGIGPTQLKLETA